MEIVTYTLDSYVYFTIVQYSKGTLVRSQKLILVELFIDVKSLMLSTFGMCIIYLGPKLPRLLRGLQYKAVRDWILSNPIIRAGSGSGAQAIGSGSGLM